MSQPHLLCPHCLHGLGAENLLDHTRLVCERCGTYWEYDEDKNRWYKYFD